MFKKGDIVVSLIDCDEVKEGQRLTVSKSYKRFTQVSTESGEMLFLANHQIKPYEFSCPDCGEILDMDEETFNKTYHDCYRRAELEREGYDVEG